MIARVAFPGLFAFQLRKGEEGLSAFDVDGVDPPLSEDEILEVFRPESIVVLRDYARIAELGLEVVSCNGAETLTECLRLTHREIRPSVGMSRSAFKNALKESE